MRHRALWWQLKQLEREMHRTQWAAREEGKAHGKLVDRVDARFNSIDAAMGKLAEQLALINGSEHAADGPQGKRSSPRRRRASAPTVRELSSTASSSASNLSTAASSAASSFVGSATAAAGAATAAAGAAAAALSTNTTLRRPTPLKVTPSGNLRPKRDTVCASATTPPTLGTPVPGAATGWAATEVAGTVTAATRAQVNRVRRVAGAIPCASSALMPTVNVVPRMPTVNVVPRSACEAGLVSRAVRAATGGTVKVRRPNLAPSV